MKYDRLYKVKAKLYRYEKSKNHYYGRLTVNGKIIKIGCTAYYNFHNKLDSDMVDLTLPVEMMIDCEREYWINRHKELEDKILKQENDKQNRMYIGKLNKDGLGADLLSVEEIKG